MNPDRLREEYQQQLRNTIMVFLNANGVSMTDIAGVFNVDKSTVSRVVKNPVDVDKSRLIHFSKYFK